MGYGVYFEGHRWAGYMVTAECDMPECHTMIDRGLGYKCEKVTTYHYFDAEGNEVGSDGDWETETEEEGEGCGLFFCEAHLYDHVAHEDNKVQPKGEHPRWMWWILNHESWEKWREENPKRVAEYAEAIKDFKPDNELLLELVATE